MLSVDSSEFPGMGTNGERDIQWVKSFCTESELPIWHWKGLCTRTFNTAAAERVLTLTSSTLAFEMLQSVFFPMQVTETESQFKFAHALCIVYCIVYCMVYCLVAF